MSNLKILPFGTKYHQVQMPGFDGGDYTAFTGDKGQCECFKTHCDARGIIDRVTLRIALKTDMDLRSNINVRS